MAESPTLEAFDLHTFYGSSHILHGINLAVHRGDTIGLMGRNGMGKTTLIRTLVGILKSSRGRVMVSGKDLTRAAPHRIAQQGIAYVPEGRGIFPNLSVRENLIVAARPGLDGTSAWTYERVLDTFPSLAKRLDHGGQQLSGGEQQMLTIGRALMTNPLLLILDEATEGLAPLIAREIWRILREIRDTGIATIIVDKNFAAMSAITSRNIILVKGRIAIEGTSDELRRQPELLQRYLGI